MFEQLLAAAAVLFATNPSPAADQTQAAAAALPQTITVAQQSENSQPIAKPGTYHKSMIVGNLKRRYVVHIPKPYREDKPLPLVIILHGGLGNQTSARWDSRSVKTSDKEQFIAVYPQGTGRSWTHLLTWNAGACCGLASTRNIDDVGFVRNLIFKMQKDYKIDASRICVAGISNGGMMAYRIGAELSDLVACIAPIAGSIQDISKAAKGPVSVIAFHGTGDSIIPYKGGDGSVFGYKLHSRPVADAITYWVNTDHCATTPIKEEDDSTFKETYTGGLNGTEVCLYTLKGGAHCWPGGRAAWPIWRKPSHELSATEIMCDFFWKHPKPTVN